MDSLLAMTMRYSQLFPDRGRKARGRWQWRTGVRPAEDDEPSFTSPAPEAAFRWGGVKAVMLDVSYCVVYNCNYGGKL